jgi:hypothetical protein
MKLDARTAAGVTPEFLAGLSHGELITLADVVSEEIGEPILREDARDRAIEQNLAVDLDADWTGDYEPAAAEALAGLPVDEVTEAEVSGVIGEIGDKLDTRDTSSARKILTVALTATALLARGRVKSSARTGDPKTGRPPNPRAAAQISANLSQADRGAITASTQDQLWWIGRLWNDHLSKTILGTVRREMLERGLGRAEVGRIMQGVIDRTFPAVEVPKTWNGSKESYFQMLAGAVRCRQSTASALYGIRDGGFTRYRFEATLDERTSEQCFRAGTRVLCADGERDISEIRVGDTVISGLGAQRRVLKTWLNEAEDWRVITLTSGRTVTVTSNHRFLTARGWRRAEDLKIGEDLAAQEKTQRSLPILREVVWVSSKERTTRSAILRTGMLPRLQGGGEASCAEVSAVRGDFLPVPDSCGAWRGTNLQHYMPPQIFLPGAPIRGARSDLRDVREDVQGSPAGAPHRESASSLLQRVSEAARTDYLRDMRVRVRGKVDERRDSKALLFPSLLPLPEDVNAAGDVRSSGPRGGGAGVPRGGAAGEPLPGLLRSGALTGDRGGWDVLALPGGRAGAGRSQGGGGASGRDSTHADLGGGHSGTGRGEADPAEYLARAAGTVRVVSNAPLRVVDVSFNLSVDGDPTYVAEGVVVHNCRILHDRVFVVNDGIDLMERVNGADDPEAVKELAGWRTADEIRGIIGDRDGAAASKALTDSGIIWPPLHGWCRSVITPD